MSSLDAPAGRLIRRGMIPPVPGLAPGRATGKIVRRHAGRERCSPRRAGEIVGLLAQRRRRRRRSTWSWACCADAAIEVEHRPGKVDRTEAILRQFCRCLRAAASSAAVEQNLRVFGMIYAVKDLSARIEELLRDYDLRPLPPDQGRGAVVRRADAAQPRQGDAQPPAPAAARRADRLDRPVDRARHPRRHRQLRRQCDRCGVLWTSHNMYEVEAVCDRVLFLSRGQIVLRGRSEDPARASTARRPSTTCSCRSRTRRCTSPRMASRHERHARRRDRAAPVLSLRGSPQRILPMFAWVAIDIVLWGFITRYLNQVSHADFNFVPALLGAVLLWDFLTRVMQGVTMAFFEDVWSRNFLNFFATPLRTSGISGRAADHRDHHQPVGPGRHAGACATSAFGLSFLRLRRAARRRSCWCCSSPASRSASPPRPWCCGSGPASEWLIWPIPTLISPFVGVFYPVTVLPVWMQAIAQVLPPSYVFEGMRAVVAGQAAPWDQLAIGGGLARGLPGARLPVLRRGLPLRDPHRPDRPLQRRDGELGPLRRRGGDTVRTRCNTSDRQGRNESESRRFFDNEGLDVATPEGGFRRCR